VTVLELIDPIERAADVKEMAEYQGIDIRKETHLLWIAKLAVLETVPERWEEFVDPGGRTLYRNLAQVAPPPSALETLSTAGLVPGGQGGLIY
jgi:hypothetical protein